MTSIIRRKNDYANFHKGAVHFWRKGLSYGNVIPHMSHERLGPIPSTYPWWTNDMDEITRLSGSEKIYVTQAGKDGVRSTRLVCLELKKNSAGWIEDVARTFFKSEELVVDMSLSTLSDASAH